MDNMQARELLNQIGSNTVAAISGGRARLAGDTLVLPVSNGYTVEIDLDSSDTYTVRRVFTRGYKRWIKGEISNIYCDQISDIAYDASCFRSNDFGPHRVA
jgi:hypothetical protein